VFSKTFISKTYFADICNFISSLKQLLLCYLRIFCFSNFYWQN